ncbi:xanthine dehydrogenase family protein subunit M [Allokutzneria sp. A3M-2-11 16]|uniref:FAD binding domain-containing protein n=1 Tax=Allokutzneria sp. A3M-2-11 16 TaxID=2962043 RepID=UPI0020B6B95F|nr:xanthine dehydrogenase family protein subunit M [Allokutzneria sp. A3M-2-11 16]MCP3802267.1 xanthine dehydrogenase family protein subunit M [Allokutzneria sp. A3M-2-11 16]
MRPFHYSRPGSVGEAVRALGADPGAEVIAGGTDLVTLLRDGVRAPSQLVDVNRLGLDRLSWQPNGSVHIGAMCRNAVDDSRLRRAYPGLVQALRSGASPQIRNRASFGGNLLQRTRCAYFRLPEFDCNKRNPGSGCAALNGDGAQTALFGASPSCVAVHPSDCAVALVALNAVVHVEGPAGARRIPIEEFHVLPGETPQRETALRRDELVVAIELPPAPPSHYLKFRDRTSFAFALVSAAVAVEVSGGTVRSARIALGGVAAKPWRCLAAERELVGKPFTAPSIAKAGDAATEGAKPRPGNEYKVELVRRVVRRALTELGNA